MLLDGRFHYLWRIQRYEAGLFLRDLQPDRSSELREPNGEPEQLELHGQNRRRRSADGAAWCAVDVLSVRAGPDMLSPA